MNGFPPLISRRELLAVVGAMAGLACRPIVAQGMGTTHEWPSPDAVASTSPPAIAHRFLTATEYAFVAAACDRFIPADLRGGGALAAAAPEYIDRQLSGPWGRGCKPYRDTPGQPGLSLGEPLMRGFPHRPAVATERAPAGIFRAAIAAIPADLEGWTGRRRPLRDPSAATDFARLSTSDQDAYLEHLGRGPADLGGIASPQLFQMVLGMTVEAFLIHPTLGLTRDRIGWPLSGFAGQRSSGA